MPTVYGIGIVWGTSATGFNTATGTADWTSTSESYSVDHDRTDLKDADGDIATAIITNRRVTLKLKCYPSGANASSYLPSPLTKVTVTAPNDPQVDGDYLVEKASKERKLEGHVEFDFELVRYVDFNGSPTTFMTTVAP